jgi:hypothetical protein
MNSSGDPIKMRVTNRGTGEDDPVVVVRYYKGTGAKKMNQHATKDGQSRY